ncbi:MAG: RNA polymerase sigma factor [Candidatus Pacebacteria bacterium]|nr:RNA polymerase sigma factor [Candidatus Paceibacterota bacterium]
MTKQEKNQQQQQSTLAAAHLDYKEGLNSYASFKVNDRMIGEDLVQDTFMKTWKYMVKGGQVNMMKAFLYHILNRLIIDEYRKHKSTSLDALFEKGFEPSVTDPDNVVDMMDGKSAILLIQRLPEIYRKIMHMRYVQDLSIEEMALLTGKTKNVIAVQTHRGLAKLKILYRNQASIAAAR